MFELRLRSKGPPLAVEIYTAGFAKLQKTSRFREIPAAGALLDDHREQNWLDCFAAVACPLDLVFNCVDGVHDPNPDTEHLGRCYERILFFRRAQLAVAVVRSSTI
jgi:hypothetical protein